MNKTFLAALFLTVAALSGYLYTANVSAPMAAAGPLPVSQSYAKGIIATGPTADLAGSTIPDTSYLKRNGLNIVGASIGSGQQMFPAANFVASLTNGATAISQTETATNKVNVVSYSFAQSVKSCIETAWQWPASYNGGTFTETYTWNTSSSSISNVVWTTDCISYASGTAVDTVFGTAQSLAVPNTGANQTVLSASSPAITCSGTPAAGQYVQLRICRDGTSGSDTLAAVANLMLTGLTFTRTNL